MDGRRMGRWIVCGGLILAGTGCKRNTLPDQSIPSPMVNNVAPPTLKKSFWGSSSRPQVPTPGMPAPEAVAEARPKKTGPMPDFEAAAADLKVELAFADPPPPNRDEMLDTARIRYQRAIQADEKHKGALLGLARMHAKLDEQEAAIEAYRNYLKHYPKDADAHHEVAQRMGQWKNWESAITWCDSALKLDPENRTYRKTMGFSMAMAGRWEEAFSTLSEIMPEAQARHNLAGLLDHLGHRDACRQQLEMALRADPGYEASREFLAELDRKSRPDSGIAAEGASDVQQAGGTMP